MTERVDDVDTLGRVEGQAPLEQVDRERVRVRVQGLERLFLLVRQRAQVVATPLRADRVKVLQGRRAEDAEYQGELVVVCGEREVSVVCHPERKRQFERRTIPPGEQRLSVEHLGQNAADGPCRDEEMSERASDQAEEVLSDVQTSMA